MLYIKIYIKRVKKTAHIHFFSVKSIRLHQVSLIRQMIYSHVNKFYILYEHKLSRIGQNRNFRILNFHERTEKLNFFVV